MLCFTWVSFVCVSVYRCAIEKGMFCLYINKSCIIRWQDYIFVKYNIFFNDHNLTHLYIVCKALDSLSRAFLVLSEFSKMNSFSILRGLFALLKRESTNRVFILLKYFDNYVVYSEKRRLL